MTTSQASTNGLGSVVNGSSISCSTYARKCKAILELYSELHALGAGMLLDLPQITVIGGQSAGKSSLVEGISGISVPRDSGTCTRCPMECSMSSSAETWSCSISLRLRYDEHGNELAAPSSIAFGPTITDRKEVDLWIRRAQAAILCPHREASEFVNKSENGLREALNATNDARVLQFSKNVVHIDVKDSELTDLSFVDLPGLIQNAEPKVIALVKSLVVENISGENTLILITIPVTDDMENQQAVRLAKEVDPQGERTIGVLTKPDTLPQGAIGLRTKWKKVLLGEAYPLQHGYYCIRLPDDAERSGNVSREESQRIASAFFDSTLPWSDVPNRRRFGVPNFVADISGLLVSLIEKNLPKLKDTVNRLVVECTDSLNKLPAPPLNEASTEILLRITSFCDDLKSTANADINKNITQTNRRRYSKFKSHIYSTTPEFRASDSDVEICFDPVAGEFNNNISVAKETDDHILLNTAPRNLLFVRKVIAESIGWELPGHVPFEATKKLVLMYTTLWKGPAIRCFEDVFQATTNFVNESLGKHFGQFSGLEGYVRNLIQPPLDKCKAEALQKLRMILELESVPLFTQNTLYLESVEKEWTSRYSNERNRFIQPVRVPAPSSTYYGVQAVPVSNTRDEFHEEIIVMAKVRAYFEVASKRIIDYVPLIIEHGLNQSLAYVLQQNLFATLLQGGGSNSQKMMELLQEDPTVASKRKFSEERKARLLQIKKKLDDFAGSGI